jgi:hypothetical protein
MNSLLYYRNLFLAGGIWNLTSGFLSLIGILLAPDFTFGLYDMNRPGSLFPYDAFFAIIISFGIGYLIVSDDLEKDHGLVKIGILTKIAVFISMVIAVILKHANLLLLLVGMIDLTFAILYIEFLRKFEHERRQSS